MKSLRLWQVVRLSRRLWVRSSLIAVLGIVAAGAAALLGPVIPQELADRLGENAVMPVLDVLASSMLAVTTFSLSIMVTTHRQASSQVTPRSHRLLLEDTTTQTVLATFIGAFIFALVSIILFRAGAYTGAAPFVLFAFTVLVVALVVVAILRWIDHLSRLGSMDETIAQATLRARETLTAARTAPSLLATPLPDGETPPDGAEAVPAPRGGYVQLVDMAALSEQAERAGAEIWINAVPGSFLVTGRALAHVHPPGALDAARIATAFEIEAVRSFEQDARFALIVLSEIASRALSPGINDPGTAIDILGRLERLLAECPAAGDEIRYPRLHAPALRADDLVEDAFAAIARDGAPMREVALRLMHALNTLRQGDDPALARAAAAMTRRALTHAEAALVIDEDKAALRRLAGL
ncbi:DUF2254 domain-containing protein [Rhodovulum sp. BSW8]|uniref:DUF2254 domain-containing protein n=1 Tax=Rhodovulum visakhapatnamense TaxID=364297 RepID=A0A4R8FWV5_9RHOB|nr:MULTISPECIES: DUF2254 domain-containing protein [Rhodovulum]OLS44329.1 hypothetical protein BV509_08230 [Rhodovulum sulfidophilum]MBL3571729.1 DUF2254 domain-containing protein [Rhodovulum visakhapatnamense]MBL3578079.1 DUF2254 domain-containing protein [Rhodovulum visakhapatnamense]RBO51965.1 DUF2254 domain-containing protein [Rhodovulum sp. BSW8]TDX27997.1 putative membrane protein [Rhodovulum visakhapatnamense]